MPDVAAERLDAFAQMSSELYWELDAELRLAFVHGRVPEMLGVPSEVLVGRHYQEILENYVPITPSEAERWRSVHRALAERRPPAETAVIWNRPDGGTVLLNLRADPFYRDGAFAGYRGITRKVGGHRLQEHEAETQFRLATAQRMARLGCWRLDTDTGEIWGTEEYYRLLGLGARNAPMTKDVFSRLVHPPDRPRLREFQERILRDGGAGDLEYRIRRPDRRIVHCVCHAEALTDRSGRVVGLTGVMQDITERKLAEQAIRAHEARLARAQNLAHMGSWEWNVGTGALWWSDEQYRLFQVDPETFQPSFAAFLDLVHHEDRERIRDLARQFTRLASTRRPYEFRAIVAGEVRIFRGCTEGWRDLNNNRVISGTVQDITQQRAAEEALLAAKERAEYASRAKSQFLATMSHELRTPLNAILGFAETMSLGVLGPLDARYREYAQNIFESGAHLRDLIDDILDLSRIEAGVLELHEEEVGVGEIVEAVLRILRPRAEKGRVRLGDEVVPVPDVKADRRLMKQVLLNLAGNAVKFTPEGGEVKIATALRRRGGRGRPWLCVVVSDTGIGMAAEDIPRALEPFSQLEGPLPRRHEGVGLGLYLCRRMVEMHDGQLVLESTPGKGTVATVWLPPRRLLAETAREIAR